MELLENTGINEYAIELVKGKQSPYSPIYSLGSIELEMLKAYIKTYLKTRFIRLSKLPKGIPIFLNKKLVGSLYLYVNHQDLNNLTIKNQYPLPLIGESLDWLGRAKRFI